MIILGPYESFWIFIIIFFITSFITVAIGWILANRKRSKVKYDMFDCGQKPDTTPHKLSIFGSVRYFAYAMAFFVLDAFVWIILSSVYPFKVSGSYIAIYFIIYIVIVLVGLTYYINRVMEVFEGE